MASQDNAHTHTKSNSFLGLAAAVSLRLLERLPLRAGWSFLANFSNATTAILVRQISWILPVKLEQLLFMNDHSHPVLMMMRPSESDIADEDEDHTLPGRTMSSSYSTDEDEDNNEEDALLEAGNIWPSLLRRLAENDSRLTDFVLQDTMLYEVEEQQDFLLEDIYGMLKEEHVHELEIALQNNTMVTHLTIRSLTIGSASHIEMLCKVLPHLKSLHLEDTRGVGMEAVARILAQSVRSSPIASTLVIPPFQGLSSSSISTSDTDIDPAMTISSPPPTPPSLNITELRLNHAQMTLTVAQHLGQALASPACSLVKLDFQGSRLSDASMHVLCQAMTKNQSVKFWCLDFNSFRTKGSMQALRHMLQHNTHLEDLHLFGNQIQGQGAISLAEGLRHNRTLKTLVLSLNDIGDDGVAALAQALTYNTTLRKLWMPSNNVGDDGLLAVAQHMPQWSGLRELNVGDSFDEPAANAMLSALKQNMVLRQLYLESPYYSCEDMDDNVDFLLRLNRAGRQKWLQQATTTKTNDSQHHGGLPDHMIPAAVERTNRFTSMTGSPDVLYHLLRRKPDVVVSHRRR